MPKFTVDARALLKDIEIEIGATQMLKMVKEHIASKPNNYLYEELYSRYREKRGLHRLDDTHIGENDTHWQVYQDNGSHYSGYYSSKVKITEEDRLFDNAIKTLMALDMIKEKERESGDLEM